MNKYMLEYHELFVKAIEEYTLKDGEDEDGEDAIYKYGINSIFESSEFREFVVKENSEMDNCFDELLCREASNDYLGVDLVDLYEELCNAPVLK